MTLSSGIDASPRQHQQRRQPWLQSQKLYGACRLLAVLCLLAAFIVRADPLRDALVESLAETSEDPVEGSQLEASIRKVGEGRGLVLPLTRRDGVTRARGLLRNATLPLHGAVKDYGYFYATLHLGTPARPFTVIVDTGSTITYVPCASCGANCGTHHKDAAFDPSTSLTAQAVNCSSGKCLCGRPVCGCSAEHQCTYSRTYAEQSSSSGILMIDQLGLGPGESSPVVFGCETKETGEIFHQEADGILGLGNSEVSIINQLAEAGAIDNTFALCFGGVEGDGALLLGDVGLPAGLALDYTPLLQSVAHPHYYLVKLDSVAVEGAQLQVPPGTYEVGYGTVLDSGTTFTYLPSPAFAQFQEQVTAAALAKGLHIVPGPDPKYHDVCFGGAPHIDQQHDLPLFFPTLELGFAQGVKLKVGPLNYLFMHAGEPGAYCLGVFDNGQAGVLLGGITFRNILVLYDRRSGRVGFAPAPCKDVGQGLGFGHLAGPCSLDIGNLTVAEGQGGRAAVPSSGAAPACRRALPPRAGQADTSVMSQAKLVPDSSRHASSSPSISSKPSTADSAMVGLLAGVAGLSAVAVAAYVTRSRWLPLLPGRPYRPMGDESSELVEVGCTNAAFSGGGGGSSRGVAGKLGSGRL